MSRSSWRHPITRRSGVGATQSAECESCELVAMIRKTLMQVG